MYSNQLPKLAFFRELFMTRPTTYFKRSASFAMLVACGAAAQAADKLTVQLDWLRRRQVLCLCRRAAGLFQGRRPGREDCSRRSSADAVTKVASGSADVGFGGISALMMAAAEAFPSRP
jgi:NitT/TauT family transport system substrate-binding protein